MKRACRIGGAGTALGLILVVAALGGALDARGAAPHPRMIAARAKSTASAQVESASVTISGTLTPAARRAIRRAHGQGYPLVIVLRATDRRKCEDLGRQLREMLRVAGDRARAVLVTEDSAAEGYRAFARREHLKATIVSFPLDSLMRDRPRLPTPAVLVDVDADGRVEGIAHPDRFANVRSRSFAVEMHSLLSGDATNTPADRGRDPH